MALFDIKGLSFSYPDGHTALCGIELCIAEGSFNVVCGKSGCGKSTLLRHLKPALTPHGKQSGSILYQNVPINEISAKDQAAQIGFVLQNPDSQIITDKVWHELAYGLESLGKDNNTIRLRVAEMASFFGIQGWYHKNTNELSGGQKQLLNLASIMAMQPVALVLDEPTSQLDPIAASDFLATIHKINSELGTTIILSEHRLEEVLPYADELIVMDSGKIFLQGAPKKTGMLLKQQNHPMSYAMPTPMRVYFELETSDSCPVTVREGKQYLEKYSPHTIKIAEKAPAKLPMLELKNLWQRYDKNSPDILRGLDYVAEQGKLHCIVGGNGTGKTTALYAIAGAQKVYRGKIFFEGKNIGKLSTKERSSLGMAMLPQDPQSLFLCNTIEEELFEMLDGNAINRDEKLAIISQISKLTEITSLLGSHPYDISGGEQQRAALAKILLTKPKLLLLDEPTKGMDSFFKQKFAEILKRLNSDGVTIVMVSHDIEFCAEYADHCALFFDGSIATENQPRAFFSGNSFYTTAANRMSRHKFCNAITVKDVVSLCKKS